MFGSATSRDSTGSGVVVAKAVGVRAIVGWGDSERFGVTGGATRDGVDEGVGDDVASGVLTGGTPVDRGAGCAGLPHAVIARARITTNSFLMTPFQWRSTTVVYCFIQWARVSGFHAPVYRFRA